MVALPADFLSVRAIYLDTTPRQDLIYLTPFELNEQWSNETGLPQNYTIIGNELVLGPAPDKQYNIVLTYQRDLTPLSSSNPSNWLLEKHPDIYLFAALSHAEFYGWNDPRAGDIQVQLEQWIEELNMLGIEKRYGGAPLAPRGQVHIRGVQA